MIKMIAAVSQNGAIGQKNKIPFDYSEDLKFFKKMTLNSTVIMGRKTYEGIGKALPKRKNIVITSSRIEYNDAEVFSDLEAAIFKNQEYRSDPGVWLIGGSAIYREGMNYADEIYITLTPDVITGDDLIFFPWINPKLFEVIEYIRLENSSLHVARYAKIH